MNDADFLNWIADRFVFVYGESENVDFIQRLRKIATDSTPNPSTRQVDRQSKEEQCL